MKTQRIQKLDINILDFFGGNEKPEDKYENAKRNYIADYSEYIPWWFFSPWYHKKNPEAWKAQWDKAYPQWLWDYVQADGGRLTAFWQQNLINKIDEIIDFINKNNGHPKTTKSK